MNVQQIAATFTSLNNRVTQLENGLRAQKAVIDKQSDEISSLQALVSATPGAASSSGEMSDFGGEAVDALGELGEGETVVKSASSGERYLSPSEVRRIRGQG